MHRSSHSLVVTVRCAMELSVPVGKRGGREGGRDRAEQSHGGRKKRNDKRKE